MSKDEIQKINEWFDKRDEDRSRDTYRSDTEYCVHHWDIEVRRYTEARALRADLYDEVFFSIKQLLDQGGEIILRSKVADMRGEE